MATETIPTKFPEHDVRVIDKLIERGMFISRSDLIREATREKINELAKIKSDADMLVKEMKEKGDFSSLEGRTLSKIYLDEKKQFAEKDFNPAEQKTIRKLLRHPFHILHKKKGVLTLTENGQSIARGYLKGLAHAKTLF